MNLYVYAGNNPVVFVDPTGLASVVVGAGGSFVLPVGGEFSGGFVVNKVAGEPWRAGAFGAAGYGAGVNVSGDVFIGYFSGGIENVAGATDNFNLALGPVSISVFENAATGDFAGFTVGGGAGFPPVGGSITRSYTGVVSGALSFESTSSTNRVTGGTGAKIH